MNIDLKKNKNMIMTGGIIILLVVVGLFFTQSSRKNAGNQDGGDDVLPQVEVLPTVDSSVKVSLKPDAKVQEIEVSVSAIPAGTTAIEYELSYDADVEGSRVPKGAIGTIDIEDKSDSITRKITLGTCSSGTCKYDKGIKSIKLSLKFQGDYGLRLFEKEFKI